MINKALEAVMDSNPSQILANDHEITKFNKKYSDLNKVIADVLEDFSLIRFISLDITSEESIERIMLEVDMLVQYKEYTLPDDALYNKQDVPE